MQQIRETKVMAGGGGPVWDKANKKTFEQKPVWNKRGSDVQF